MAAFVNVESARFEDQRKIMEKIAEVGECPFCPENIAKYHRQPILVASDFWVVTRAQWPYKHTKHHFLIISKFHAERLHDLPPDAGRELFYLLAAIESEYNLKTGAVVMRFGDICYNGASVKHMHAHLATPDIDDPKFETIRFKIGQFPKKMKK